jgi:geranylgeranyl diphosphate synthase type II
VEILSKIKDLFVFKSDGVLYPSQAIELKQWFTNQQTDIDAKKIAVKILTGGSQATQDAIQDFTFKAFDTLDKMNLDTTKKRC